MCGRFAQRKPIQDILERFNILDPEEVLFEPRYNIAPTQYSPVVIIENDQRILRLMKWGLVPFWSKDLKTGYKMINARSEGIETKPSFKNPLKKRRCLVITDGFYEWHRIDKKNKVPYFTTLKDHKPFAFAGMWDRWEKGDEPLETFTIITTGANKLMETIHNRMPVILHEKDESRWLDPELQDYAKIKPLLKPFPSKEMDMHQVSKIVNSPKNDVPECVVPINN